MSPAVVVNGRSRDLREVGGHVTLLEWLRGSGLTGAKEGCAEGECGACAVLVARDDGAGGTRWVAINACLVPAAGFDQQEVVTAEGLGQPGDLHPVQREMARRGGSQCGYCTPGFICAMAAEYYRPGRAPRQPQPATATQPHSNGRTPSPATTSTARTGSTCTRSAATCAAAPATGPSGTPPTPSAHRTRPTRCWPARPARPRRPRRPA